MATAAAALAPHEPEEAFFAHSFAGGLRSGHRGRAPALSFGGKAVFRAPEPPLEPDRKEQWMDARQLVKDATAVGAVASAGGLFVVRACRADKALPRAGRNALNGAALAAPLAGVWGFAVAKDSHYKWEREEALEMTAYWGGVAALAAGALCGLASLARDAFRA